MYASHTVVPVEKSIEEMRAVLTKFGATGFAYAAQDSSAYIAFTYKNRAVRLTFNTPPAPSKDSGDAEKKRFEQTRKTLWRQLALFVKVKLACVSSGIETFEEAFMAHLVVKDGRVLGETILGMIDELGSKSPQEVLGFFKEAV